ncbi:MAG: superoxide dismutase [Bacteroidota bacterium]|nr:superoxide dismutase [Bacteroidota bacterium]
MDNSRRNFLRNAGLFSLGTLASSAVGNEGLNKLDQLGKLAAIDGGKYTLPVLPYAYNALEPFIDKQTMEIHHTKHHQAYVDNLNKALESYTGKDLESPHSFENIFKVVSKLPAAIRNNAGGHYNHSLFWSLMKANPEGYKSIPEGKSAELINKTFGSFEAFQKQFTDAALKRFGSGWAWAYLESGVLKIGSTANQDNPLMNNAEIQGKPVLALDVWEHAYYLKYQNKRADYINNWWNVVNWNKVNDLLA